MTATTFQAIDPTTGIAFGDQITEMSASDVAGLISKAVATKNSFAATTPKERAAALRAIGEAIESSREKLIEITMRETALPNGRLTGELSRTVFQLEQFAKLVESGAHYQAIIDRPDANWVPAPRQDIRKANQALGVAGIFAASNFPFAFSVIGGDSASALAAGCPVVVKAHPSHPNTCRAMHAAVVAGLKKVGLPPDIFALVEGTNPEITHWIASHPDITAIGFTGSGKVGKILMEISAKREVPIPVYAEMGSLNPVFFSPKVLAEKAADLAKAAMDSALLGSGQFCTKPGIMIVPKDSAGDKFIAQVQSHVAEQKVGPLLNKGIATRFTEAISSISKAKGVKVLTGVTNPDGYGVTPSIFVVDWEDVKNHDDLLEEHFGPTSVIIRAEFSQYLSIAKAMSGQLASAVHAGSNEDVKDLVSALTQLAGRLIWNGFPTSVSVTAAQNHGGQWPASSSHTTSVGLDALYRFVRPVVYQNFPDNLLPAELQNANPYGIERVVNGVRSTKAIN